MRSPGGASVEEGKDRVRITIFGDHGRATHMSVGAHPLPEMIDLIVRYSEVEHHKELSRVATNPRAAAAPRDLGPRHRGEVRATRSHSVRPSRAGGRSTGAPGL